MAEQIQQALLDKPPTTPSKTKWILVGVVALLLGLFVGWAFLQVVSGPYTYHGTVIQSPKPAADFTLTGKGGAPVSLSDFRGQVVLLYFGYTFCPDVCPATSVAMAQVMKTLGGDAEALQVIMVSLDPQRDTPDKLETYMTHFDPSFIGLTGSEDEIATAATPYGIFYEKHPGTVESGYLIDHTASIVAIDAEGYLRLLYPFSTPAVDIAADVRELAK